MEMSERTPFGQRLVQAREDAGFSQEEAAKQVGMAQRTLSEAEVSGKRSGFTPQLAALYKVNPIWLSTGKGQKEISNKEIHEEKSNVRRFTGKLGEVPKISWVKAGALCDVDDPFEPGDAKDWLICPVKHGPRTFALQVDGDSMDAGDRDSYPDGYDIFVDPDVEPRHGDDVVVRTPNGTATFKRLQINADGKYLLALNPQWPDRIVRVPEGTVICGVVIYSGKPRR